FFFSSRRRHTRLVSDWSSDVCSSDLIAARGERKARNQARELRVRIAARDVDARDTRNRKTARRSAARRVLIVELGQTCRKGVEQIGRAACRGRGWREVVGVSVEERMN